MSVNAGDILRGELVMEEDDNKNKIELKVFGKRWMILAIAVIYQLVSCINIVCFGHINNVLVKLLRVKPYEVDWIFLAADSTYIGLSVPVAAVATKLGFRKLTLLMVLCMVVGCMLLFLGVMVQQHGYPVVVLGELFLGMSFVFNFSIIPLLPAVWFPANEVAVAIALQMVARGVGIGVGSVITPHIVAVDQSIPTIRMHLMIMFGIVSFISILLFVASYFMVDDCPPSPPTISRSKTYLDDKTESMWTVLKSFKGFFMNGSFLVVLFVYSVIFPINNVYTVLLASILHKRFPGRTGLNKTSGLVVMCSWVVGAVAGCFIGPIIIKTKTYKPVLLVGVASTVLCTTTVTLGVYFGQVIAITAGIISMGICDITCSISMLELMAEVIFPKSIEQCAMIAASTMAVVQLTYVLANRAILTHWGAWESTVFPVVTSFVACTILCIVPTPYRRSKENGGITESQELLPREG
ncbi:choline/ethanolamine transporter FLVCR2-like [Ciona intestinalis]